MFSVDGIIWSLPCDVKRTAEVHSTEISGWLIDGSYFNDVDGTYMSYEISICPNPQQLGDYYQLYELLTQPVDAHQFVLPYNGENVQITARLDAPISDIWVRLPYGGRYWKGIRFTIAANGPTKQQQLQQAITRGLTPLPEAETAEIGDTYTFTANGWVPAESYPNADEMAF